MTDLRKVNIDAKLMLSGLYFYLIENVLMEIGEDYVR